MYILIEYVFSLIDKETDCQSCFDLQETIVSLLEKQGINQLRFWIKLFRQILVDAEGKQKLFNISLT